MMAIYLVGVLSAMGYFSKIGEKASVLLKDRHNFAALCIVVFALALRLNYAFISGMWVDEGRYAVIGRALLDHPFDYSSRMHGVVTIFPPVFPYMLFVSQAIFGAGDFAVRIVNPVLGALSVLLVYALGRLMFSKNIGLIAAALFSVSPISWFYDDRILLETPMTFFSLLTIFSFYYGFERKNNKLLYASGIFMMLAYLSKQSAGFVLPAIMVYLTVSKKFAWLKDKRIWIVAAVFILAMLPWAIRSYNACGNISCEGSRAINWFRTSSAGDIDVVFDPYYYISLTPYLLTAPVLVLFFFGLIPAVNGKNRKEYALLTTVALITYLFFSINPVKDLRFVLLAVPPILLIAAQGVDEIARQFAGKNIKYMPLVAIAILLPVMYMSYGAGKATILDKAPGFLMLKDAGLYFEKMSPDTVIMAAPSQPISFYGGDKKMSFYPENQSDFEKELYNTNTSYVVIDAYERTQRPWIWGYVPKQDYLALEKVFYQNGQPVVGIFKVDREGLMNAIQNRTGG